MPVHRNISVWDLLVVDRPEPGYVNSVTSSTECLLTDKLDMLESPAPRFWIFVFCQDTCIPSFDAVVSKMSREV